MNIRIYILSYNDETFNFALQKYQSLPWAKVIKIDSSVLFESIVFDSWLIDNFHDWNNYDYIGFLSWKFEQKIPFASLEYAFNILNYDNSIEVFPLFYGNPIYFFDAKNLYPILDILFDNLGFEKNFISNNRFKPFYCNYWIAKKNILIEYIYFFKRCVNIINSNKDIQNLIWDNIHYANIANIDLMKIFNKPYYCYHPFIYERIPIFFFHNKKIYIPPNLPFK